MTIASSALADFAAERRRQLEPPATLARALATDAPAGALLERILIASDFAYEEWLKRPELLAILLERDRAEPPAAPADAAELRRYRRAQSLRALVLDFAADEDFPQHGRRLTRIAERCLDAALVLAGRDRRLPCPAGLAVLGLGKLGGAELNFSSDVDLIYAVPATDEEQEEGWQRLARRLGSILHDRTEDGFVLRVDLRLRPFGNVGPLVLSFPALEQYYQHDGRDWERYAWIKARPVAGDLRAGAALIEALRPFVYRRYLDYGAYQGLRELKQLIDAEVRRRSREHDLKLGPGGIREIEFLVQAEQLIRGGREPRLRTPGTLAALDVLAACGIWSSERCTTLRAAYLFLRRLEHRLQMQSDAQCHALPLDPWTRERIAAGLGYAHWTALADALEHHRAVVAEHFDRALPMAAEPTRGATVAAALPIDPIAGAATGSSVRSLAPALRERLDAFLQSGLVQSLGAIERDRLERALPVLLQAAAATTAAERCLPRLLDFVQAVARRSAYLALLAEQPRVAEALAQLFARSAYLARLLTQMPLLLDELLDARRLELPFDPELIGAELAEQIERATDTEQALDRLRESQRAWQLRAAVQFLDGRMDAVATTRALAVLAEHVVSSVLRLAERDLRAQHGLPSGRRGGFLVLGYGSLGGLELNFASDLDLVFVYAPSLEGGSSDGAKPLDNHRYFVRLAQRLTHLLTMTSVAGPLYEIDTRLRPNGRKGLLITSLRAYAEYQRRHAWTWEHQALVRARPIAGDVTLARRFRRLRHALLTAPRPAEPLGAEVRAMRQRMRAELDRSDGERFDLKQGAGGLVDIEFWLQEVVLRRGAAPEPPSSTPDLIEAAMRSGNLPADRAAGIREAHRRWLELGLDATLALKPRVLTLAAEDRRLAAAVAQWCGFAAP